MITVSAWGVRGAKPRRLGCGGWAPTGRRERASMIQTDSPNQ